MVMDPRLGDCVMGSAGLCVVPQWRVLWRRGRSRVERSAVVESKSLQQIGSGSRVRRLKIEPHGDFFKGLIRPKIRLVGLWLERAGFSPGSHVQVTCVAPGVIELRSLTALSQNPAKPASSAQANQSL